MFNWVCPQCGKDVSPSKTECPDCAERARQAGLTAPPVPPQQQAPPAWQPPPPQAWQPPAAPPPPQPQYQQPYSAPPPAPPQAQHHEHPGMPPQWQPPQYPQHAQHGAPPWQQQPHRSGPPAWVMALGFAVIFIGLFAAVYLGIKYFSRSNPAEKAGLENPSNASQQKVSNPLQKYVEVVGIRMMAENKKPVAKFLVVNHSNTEITGMEANVTLWASTSRSEEDSVGSFTFKLKQLAGNGSQELTAPLKTKFKAYELPDWQNATPEIQIVSPQ